MYEVQTSTVSMDREKARMSSECLLVHIHHTSALYHSQKPLLVPGSPKAAIPVHYLVGPNYQSLTLEYKSYTIRVYTQIFRYFRSLRSPEGISPCATGIMDPLRQMLTQWVPEKRIAIRNMKINILCCI